MNTEEDTFKRLRRPTYKQVYEKLLKMYIDPGPHPTTTEDTISLVEANGWTWDDFFETDRQFYERGGNALFCYRHAMNKRNNI